MHLAVAGNIGSGKTTLTRLLSKHYGWEAHYEDIEDNPYLNDFYNDMQRWSFNLQIYFLNSRFNHILSFRKTGKTLIQDRTIYEDAYIFAPNLHSMGLMSTRDFENYFTLFNLILHKLIKSKKLMDIEQAQKLNNMAMKFCDLSTSQRRCNQDIDEFIKTREEIQHKITELSQF